MRQSQCFAAGVCLPVPSGCFAPASQCNILTVVRDVDLLAITRLFNERGRVNAGAKDRCETFGVYWRPVFTNGWRPPQQSAPCAIFQVACLLAGCCPRTDERRPWDFRHMLSRRLMPDSSSHRPFTTHPTHSIQQTRRNVLRVRDCSFGC
jgi:hypothetical protein